MRVKWKVSGCGGLVEIGDKERKQAWIGGWNTAGVMRVVRLSRMLCGDEQEDRLVTEHPRNYRFW